MRYNLIFIHGVLKDHGSNHKGGVEAINECPIGLNAMPVLAHRNRNFSDEQRGVRGILCFRAVNAQLPVFGNKYHTDYGKPEGKVLPDELTISSGAIVNDRGPRVIELAEMFWDVQKRSREILVL